jgi:3-methyl-2-oxobutanoate hydroxymethyltransferase
MKTGRITVRKILKQKGGEKIVAVTAYDYPTAKLADAAEVDLILVGDSVGNVVLGYENTLPVTMEEMLHHCRAVARAKPRALVIADMPYLSFQVSVEEAVRNAGRFVKEAGVDGVKLERGIYAEAAAAIVQASIPVVGHVGLAPQSLLQYGGYRVQGRSEEEASRVLAEARALERAGCFCVVLECIPSALASELTRTLRIPTIGIGAGKGCDGQIQVFHDLFGLEPSFIPKHARRYADLSSTIVEGLKKYRDDVRAGDFPGEDETFDS